MNIKSFKVKTVSCIIAIGATTINTSTVLAEPEYYGGLQLGAHVALDDNLSLSHAGGANMDVTKAPGLSAGFVLGMQDDKVRVEFDYLRRQNRLGVFDVSNSGTSALASGHLDAEGKAISDSLMANALYNIGNTNDWQAYAGLGIGLSRIQFSEATAGGINVSNDSDWALAGQLMLDLVRPINETVDFSIGYRFFRTAAADISVLGGNESLNFSGHDLMARLTWKFGGTKVKKAVTPAKRPEPLVQPAKPSKEDLENESNNESKSESKPVPVPLPAPFIVYFDFDQSKITSEADRIIRNAANAYKKHGVIRVLAVGHADRAGKISYNDELSLHRAKAVEKALIKLGVLKDHIEIDSKGETAPSVTTADGIREARNRRVEIILKR